MDDASLVIRRADDPLPKPLTRYEDDVHAWAFEQAALLKAGRLAELDLMNLADEIEDVGHQEQDKLESNLSIVIQHLLKWDFQESRRSRSWVNSIREHRRRVKKQLAKSRSLDGHRDEALVEAYARGKGDALIETGLPEREFPAVNPYSWDDVMRREIVWPEV